jgi:biopolymer transport protein ExbB/TolQ
MKQINPLYILALVVIVTLFSIYQNTQAKISLQTLENKYMQTHSLAQKLSALKKAYSKEQVQHLANILKHRNDLHVQLKHNKLEITGEKVGVKTLDFVFSKVLNGNYNVKNLSLIALKNVKTKLKMEIVW